MNKKLSKDYMVDKIKEDLLYYFKQGIINPVPFIKLDGINFKNRKDILKIHFLLSKKVEEYITNLESNIRQVKNSTKLEKEVNYSKIKGSINWNDTIIERVKSGNINKNKFVVDSRDKLYNTSENIVLKLSLKLIYDLIFKDLGMDRFYKYDWYKNGEKHSNIIKNIYKNNSYVKKIDIKNIKLTDSMLNRVVKSRNKIYRDSAEILIYYKNIISLKDEAIKDLFSNTFINLLEKEDLFELYNIFLLIRNNFNGKDIRYNVLDGNEECICKLKDRYNTYYIYHNSTASKYLKFNVDVEEIKDVENDYIERYLAVKERKSNIYKELEKRSLQTNIWGGRPDLVILKENKRNKKVEKLILGEVKYTNSRNYMYQGLEELLEYMYLAKDINNNYLDNVSITGLLFVDNIKLEKNYFENIQIVSRDNKSKKINLN